jgi:Uncharacterised conserved protein (DUF2343).
MRLFLIPISTKRALIYARPLNKDLAKELSILDRVTTKAAEHGRSGRKPTKDGRCTLFAGAIEFSNGYHTKNGPSKASLHSKTQLRVNGDHGKTKVDVLFPGNAVRLERIQQVVRTIATERQEIHRNRMMWSLIAAPITAPFGLIPVYVNATSFPR